MSLIEEVFLYDQAFCGGEILFGLEHDPDPTAKLFDDDPVDNDSLVFTDNLYDSEEDDD